MLDNPPVREPQARYPHFTPWPNRAERSFRSCAHATDYDGVHLWCERFRLVVIDACGCWERGAKCEKQEF